MGHRNIFQTHFASNTKILSWIFKDIEKLPEFYQIDLPEPVSTSYSINKPANFYTAIKSPSERLEKSLSRDT